uniref:EGF-like domain-containing protein n=1 Tax=Magallana gigas TaxID=29159 RepID=A0A8W8LUR0_MAGGI
MANSTFNLLVVPTIFLTTLLLSFVSSENNAHVQVDSCTTYCNTTMFQHCKCTNFSTIMECDKTSWVGIYLSMTVNNTGPGNTSFPLFYTLMYDNTTFCQGQLEIPPSGKEVKIYLPESDDKANPIVNLTTTGKHKLTLPLKNIENSIQTASNILSKSAYIENTTIRVSDFRVYYGCEAGKNQLCDKSGHVICAPCYYGDKCQTYCNSTMFENCNCSTDGKLQCSEKPVGVYFDVRLISAHIPPNMHNTSYTLSLDQSYRNISFRRLTFSPLILHETPDLAPLGFSNNTMVFFYPSFNLLKDASCTISIEKDGNIKAGQIFHLSAVSSSRSVDIYLNLTLPEKKNDSGLYFNIQIRLAYNCTPSSENQKCNKTGELVCKENFLGDDCQSNTEYERCTVNKTNKCEVQACCGSGDCPVVVFNNGIQNYQQDSLSMNWRLIASILGAISIALSIVLFAEIGKMKYRNLMGVSSMVTPDTWKKNTVN